METTSQLLTLRTRLKAAVAEAAPQQDSAISLRYMRNVVFMVVLVFYSVAHAQVTTYYGAEKVFMDRCSPVGTTADVQKACRCLMKSITRSMTLQEFNGLEERAQMGTLSEAEIAQKRLLLAKSRLALQECVSQ